MKEMEEREEKERGASKGRGRRGEVEKVEWGRGKKRRGDDLRKNAAWVYKKKRKRYNGKMVWVKNRVKWEKSLGLY